MIQFDLNQYADSLTGKPARHCHVTRFDVDRTPGEPDGLIVVTACKEVFYIASGAERLLVIRGCSGLQACQVCLVVKIEGMMKRVEWWLKNLDPADLEFDFGAVGA